MRGGAASLGAALSLGRRGTIPSASHDGGAVRSSDIALCKCMTPPLSHDEGAVPSSHDKGAVPSLCWGASVSCGSARVLALYARGAEVAVVVGVAVGAVAVVVGVAVGAVAVVMGVAVSAVPGVARSAGWGSLGSSCGVESSLAPRTES